MDYDKLDNGQLGKNQLGDDQLGNFMHLYTSVDKTKTFSGYLYYI